VADKASSSHAPCQWGREAYDVDAILQNAGRRVCVCVRQVESWHKPQKFEFDRLTSRKR